jgi:hypothetical protein
MPEARTNTEIIMYREGVASLLEAHANKMINNGLPEHAAVLFEQFFKNAQEQVCIFCKNLAAPVFGRQFVVDAAREALGRGIRIEILLQDSQPEQSSFTDLLRKAPSGVTITTAQSEVAKTFKVNFAVMDLRAYRFEEDRERFKATANMFDPCIAAKLFQKFVEQQQTNSTKLIWAAANG